jgi:hypothetical protein
MQMQSLQKFCKTCPTPIEHGVPQKENFCKELTSQLSSSFKTFSIPAECQRQQQACRLEGQKEVLMGPRRRGRIERQLVKKKAVTHFGAGGSFMDCCYNC